MADDVACVGSNGSAPEAEAGALLASVERFLLPPRDAAFAQLGTFQERACAKDRLHAITYQVAVADQIRLMQSYYRDNHDDYCVCEALRTPETRVPGALPTKDLLRVVTEGRARMVALSKLVHGNASLRTVKATTELASAYAVQGLWEQAATHAIKARQRLEAFAHLEKTAPHLAVPINREAAEQAAQAVLAMTSLLRSHAIAHAGTIQPGFVEELQSLRIGAEEVSEAVQRALDKAGTNTSTKTASLPPSAANSTSDSSESSDAESIATVLSWGNAIAILRQTEWLRNHLELMSSWLLPSWLAALRFAFAAADQDSRGLAHSQELVRCLKAYSAPLRATSSTDMLTTLSQLESRIEIPLSNPVYLNDTLINTVTYDLPVTWEELLAGYILGLSISMHDVVRYEISTIMGICCTYIGRLVDAEAAFQEAIQLVDKMGIDSDLLACDLYNSIAQLLLAKHKNAEESKKQRSQEIATDWLRTDEGKAAVREYAMKHPLGKDTPATTARSSEASAPVDDPLQKFGDVATRNAYRTLFQRHMKQVLRQEADASTGDLLAAYRYLMRSVDIQERICDHIQPAIASAAISVASIEYVRGRYEEARDWLVQSIRTYERQQPVGARGVAFVQVQLSHVFQRLKRPTEAGTVLEAAVLFHSSTARHKAFLFHQLQDSIFEENRAPSNEDKLRLTAMERDFQEEAALTSQLQFRAAALHADEAKWDSALNTLEEAVEFAGFIFGWDSPEAADARREYAKLLLKVHQPAKAQQQLENANEIYRLVYGPTDHRVTETIAELKKLQAR